MGLKKNPWAKKDVARKHRHCSMWSRCQDLWIKIANQELARHGDKVRAIRVANHVANNWLRAKGKKNPTLRVAYVDLDGTLIAYSRFGDVQARPGAQEWLKNLRKYYDQVHLFTAGSLNYQTEVLRHLQLISYFDKIYAIEHMGSAIGHPQEFAVLFDDLPLEHSNTQGKLSSLVAVDKHLVVVPKWHGHPEDMRLLEVEML